MSHLIMDDPFTSELSPGLWALQLQFFCGDGIITTGLRGAGKMPLGNPMLIIIPFACTKSPMVSAWKCDHNLLGMECPTPAGNVVART